MKDASALIVDSGNFCSSGRLKSNLLKVEYLAQAMTKMGYSAVNLGESDLSLGSHFLAALREKYDLPLISANVYYQDNGQRFTRPSIIVRLGGSNFLGMAYGGIRVGILGLADDASQMLSPQVKEAIKKFEGSTEDERELEVRDPKEEAEKVIKKLRGKCDVIVVLTEIRKGNLQKLLEEVDGIDVVIGGRTSSPDGAPERIGGSIFVTAGSLGKYGGDMTVVLGNDGEIASFEGKAIPMEDSIHSDEEMERLISEYKDALKAQREQKSSP